MLININGYLSIECAKLAVKHCFVKMPTISIQGKNEKNEAKFFLSLT